MDNIIHYMRTQAPALAPLFRSAGQARLLAAVLLFDEERSLADLAEQAQLAYPTAHREVGRLLAAGIFQERLAGRTRLISANLDSPLVAPLREILATTYGPVALLGEELRQIPRIEQAFIYGSFAARAQGIAGDAPADIDLMVIGAPDPSAVFDVASSIEDKVGRPINPTIFSVQEWSEPSAFIDEVKANPILVILGEAK